MSTSLVRLAESAGLDRDTARTVLEERRFKDAVDVDWEKSRTYGVTGVPTFVAGDQKLVGAHPYETLDALMRQVGATEARSRGIDPKDHPAKSAAGKGIPDGIPIALRSFF